MPRRPCRSSPSEGLGSLRRSSHFSARRCHAPSNTRRIGARGRGGVGGDWGGTGDAALPCGRSSNHGRDVRDQGRRRRHGESVAQPAAAVPSPATAERASSGGGCGEQDCESVSAAADGTQRTTISIARIHAGGRSSSSSGSGGGGGGSSSSSSNSSPIGQSAAAAFRSPSWHGRGAREAQEIHWKSGRRVGAHLVRKHTIIASETDDLLGRVARPSRSCLAM